MLGASAVSEVARRDRPVVLVADVDPRARGLGWTGLTGCWTPNRTWTDGWHGAHAGTVRAGRLVVRPTWVGRLTAQDVGRAPSRWCSTPGDAFGSGSHATTRLCLAALEPLAPSW